jgi:large subunit ribosomal protein L21
MYAIIENDGKQYKISPGDTIQVEKLSREPEENVTLEKVIMVKKDEKILYGSPYISGAKVIAKVVNHGKAGKVLVYKQKPRKTYRRLRGHRQPYTSLKINEIVIGG